MLPPFYRDTTFFLIPYYGNNENPEPLLQQHFRKRTRVVVITEFHCIVTEQKCEFLPASGGLQSLSVICDWIISDSRPN